MNKNISKSELEEIKKQALADYTKYVNPQKTRTLRSVGLDLIEEKRDGACTWDITGKRFIIYDQCFYRHGIWRFSGLGAFHSLYVVY